MKRDSRSPSLADQTAVSALMNAVVTRNAVSRLAYTIGEKRGNKIRKKRYIGERGKEVKDETRKKKREKTIHGKSENVGAKERETDRKERESKSDEEDENKKEEKR